MTLCRTGKSTVATQTARRCVYVDPPLSRQEQTARQRQRSLNIEHCTFDFVHRAGGIECGTVVYSVVYSLPYRIVSSYSVIIPLLLLQEVRVHHRKGLSDALAVVPMGPDGVVQRVTGQWWLACHLEVSGMIHVDIKRFLSTCS